MGDSSDEDTPVAKLVQQSDEAAVAPSLSSPNANSDSESESELPLLQLAEQKKKGVSRKAASAKGQDVKSKKDGDESDDSAPELPESSKAGKPSLGKKSIAGAALRKLSKLPAAVVADTKDASARKRVGADAGSGKKSIGKRRKATASLPSASTGEIADVGSEDDRHVGLEPEEVGESGQQPPAEARKTPIMSSDEDGSDGDSPNGSDDADDEELSLAEIVQAAQQGKGAGQPAAKKQKATLSDESDGEGSDGAVSDDVRSNSGGRESDESADGASAAAESDGSEWAPETKKTNTSKKRGARKPTKKSSKAADGYSSDGSDESDGSDGARGKKRGKGRPAPAKKRSAFSDSESEEAGPSVIKRVPLCPSVLGSPYSPAPASAPTSLPPQPLTARLQPPFTHCYRQRPCDTPSCIAVFAG